MQALSTFEGGILLWIQNHLRVEALTPLFTFLTHLGDKGLLWIGISLVLLAIPKTRRIGVTCVISIVLSFTLANLILKPLVNRTRPYEFIEGLVNLIENQHDKSFPSGHATNAFAVAWVMFRCMDKKWGVPAVVLASVICFTRLYVGVHYPTDVIFGILIGIAASEAAILIVRCLVRRYPGFRRFVKARGKKPSNVRSTVRK